VGPHTARQPGDIDRIVPGDRHACSSVSAIASSATENSFCFPRLSGIKGCFRSTTNPTLFLQGHSSISFSSHGRHFQTLFFTLKIFAGSARL